MPADESPARAPFTNAPRIITGRYAGPEGERAWRLAVPAAVAPTPRPMVVMLHGCLQDAADIARGSRFDALAERAGALVLYPEQPASANVRKCWNWFDAAHQRRGAGEPALLAALVRDVARVHRGDTARVHLVGISAGGAMANLLVGAYPELFSSVTTIAGVPWRAAPDVGSALTVMQQGAGATLPSGADWLAAAGAEARLTPVVVVHGLADQVVSVRNADETVRQYVDAYDLLLARGGDSALQRHDLEPATEHEYVVRESQWRTAQGAVLVTLVRVEQLGHAFPFGEGSGSFTDAHGPDLVTRLAALITSSH